MLESEVTEPQSGSIPFTPGGLAGILRIPIPGTNGLAIELSPRGKVPKGGSTSTLFIQGVDGKRHLRLDYGYNKQTQALDYHWNQQGTHSDFGIANHTSTSRLGKIGYHAAKYFKYAGRVLVVLGVAVDAVSIVQADKPLRRASEAVAGWAGAWLGCKVVGAGGAAVGSAVMPGPGTAISGIVGCIVGGIGGYNVGETTARKVYDWVEDTNFSVLEEIDKILAQSLVKSVSGFAGPVLPSPCEQVLELLIHGAGILDAAAQRYSKYDPEQSDSLYDTLYDLSPFRPLGDFAQFISELFSVGPKSPNLIELLQRHQCNRLLSYLLLKLDKGLPNTAGDDAGASLDDGRFRILTGTGNTPLIAGRSSNVLLAPCDRMEYQKYPAYTYEWYVLFEPDPAGTRVKRTGTKKVYDAGTAGIITCSELPFWNRSRDSFPFHEDWPPGRHIVICRLQALNAERQLTGSPTYYSAPIQVVSTTQAVMALRNRAESARKRPKLPHEEAEDFARYRQLLAEIAVKGPPMDDVVAERHREDCRRVDELTMTAQLFADKLQKRQLRVWPVYGWWFAQDKAPHEPKLNAIMEQYARDTCRGVTSQGAQQEVEPDAELRMVLLGKEEDGLIRWTLLDWTDLHLDQGTKGRLKGKDFDRIFSGVGNPFQDSIKDAVAQWDVKNRYPPGTIGLLIPTGFDIHEIAGPTQRFWVFTTDGKTNLDEARLWTGVIAIFVSLAVFALPVAVAPVAMVVATGLATAGGVIDIYQNMEYGIDEWSDYALDVLTIIAGALRLFAISRQMVRAVRLAPEVTLTNGAKIIDPVRLSITGIEGIENLLIGKDHYDRIHEILSDPSKTPAEKIGEAAKYLIPLILVRTLVIGIEKSVASNSKMKSSQPDTGKSLKVQGTVRSSHTQKHRVIINAERGRTAEALAKTYYEKQGSVFFGQVKVTIKTKDGRILNGTLDALVVKDGQKIMVEVKSGESPLRELQELLLTNKQQIETLHFHRRGLEGYGIEKGQKLSINDFKTRVFWTDSVPNEEIGTWKF